MLVLSLDTATAATAVAVLTAEPDGLRTLAARRHVDPRAHGERLTPQIDEVLVDAGVRAADLTGIVAGTGPGPFTGLRIGLVTAAAMGDALGIPTYGVCSLDGIGAAVPGRGLVATDARRREIYWAVYQDGARLTDPAVDRPEDVPVGQLEVARSYGEGALRYRVVLGLPVAESLLHPDPAWLVTAALPQLRGAEPAQPLAPRYLRRPDATLPRPVTRHG